MSTNLPLWRDRSRITALLFCGAIFVLQGFALRQLFNRLRNARALPTSYTDPLLQEKIGRALTISELHLVGVALLLLLLLALWLPRWPDGMGRTVFRAVAPALGIPLCSVLAWGVWAGVDLRYEGDAKAIGMIGAVAGVFLPLLSLIFVGQLRNRASFSHLAPLFIACLLIELWSLVFGLCALILGLGA